MPDRHPIELVLFAPYNEAVELTASWNEWTRQSMTKDNDGYWRITCELADGEHQYKFVVKSNSYFAVHEWIEVFDPYALSITNDEAERTLLTIKNGKRVWVEHNWKYDEVPLPGNEQLILYELHVGDFSGGLGDTASPRARGNFRGVIEKLDYLSELGINAVELLPIKEFPGKSWGYNLRSLFAIDSSYGTPAELCRLVDECHRRGIRVIVDGVYNHAEADAPLAKIDYQYWFYRENPDPPIMQWGPKYNYTHYDENLKIFPARKYVMESIRDLVRHFHIDGIRFDATRGIKDFDIMREFADLAFKEIDGRKPFFTVAEHAPEDPAITGYPAGPMVAAWHESFAKHLQAVAIRHELDGEQPWDLDALELHMDVTRNGYKSGNHAVNYIGSHDQDRILHQIGDISHTFGEAAFARVKLATGLLFTSPGLPMIWMGQEFGASSPKSLDSQPIDWALFQNADNKGLYEYTAAFCKLRHSTPALRTDNFQVILKDKARCVFAYKRWDDAGGVVVVAANLKHKHAGEVVLADAGLDDGDWHEYVFNFDANVKQGVLKFELGPSEVKVFVKK